MDGVGSEVSQKIRAAIKAKLIELEAYVDDELPDYIMVMVANKRSRVQMEQDLSLFLNKNTQTFTSWLHSVLQKLQEVTISNEVKKEKEKEKVTSKKVAKKRRSLSKASKTDEPEKKKKHRKKKKERKVKREKFKTKSKASYASTDSEWEKDEKPKKKAKKDKEKEKEKIPAGVDVTKEVGKAIIDSLKEKHVSEGKTKQAEVAETVEAVAATIEEVIAETPLIVEPPLVKEKEIEIAKEDDPDDFSIIEVRLAPEPTPPEPQPTVLAPTKELLAKHDEIAKLAVQEVKVSDQLSDDSTPPEELRKQLLLSRAKRKLEERNLEKRMRSNSPEVIIVDEKKISNGQNHKTPDEVKRKSKSKSPNLTLSLSPSISLRSEGRSSADYKVGHTLNSRIVAPAVVEPQEPGVASVVRVMPRVFEPKEKQANKNLILKAVAAAERSVATAPVRKAVATTEESKRPREIFTRDLRGKRYKNFAVTLNNDRTKRNNAAEETTDDIDAAGGDENFISSKTTAKERNESFIQCWLQDVEKAEKQDGLLPPDELCVDIAETEDSDGKRKEGGGETLGGKQILVTVGRKYRSDDEENSSSNANNKSSTNRVSDRFTNVNQPEEEEDSKAKIREFEKTRKKEGESKNKKLIAALSVKFGQVNRLFEDEEEEEEEPRRHALKGRLGSGVVEVEDRNVKRRLGQDHGFSSSRYHYHRSSSPPRSRERSWNRVSDWCRYDGYCKNPDCRYQHRKISRGRESSRT